MEKNKQWKNEMLMENLRSKSSKTFLELAKSFRLNLLERRYNIDSVEKQTLQTALDNLQSNIQIKNRSTLVERLESLTRHQLLKFTDNTNTNSLFISSDMFYLEILLDPLSGKINDVKVHHECSNESESEPHLVEVLRKGDFIDFTQQLEGFQSIYQLNAESKIKSKAFIAIQALEVDLMNIQNVDVMQHGTPEAMVMKSSVGLVTKRRGGHPMRLLFFVRPTELLNLEEKRMDSLTDALKTAAAAKKHIGNSVTINLEATAPSNKLQIVPLLIKKPDGSGFTYNPISLNNSTMLPAAFVLRLNKSMPVTTTIVEEIKKITNNLGVFYDDGSGVKQETPPGSLVNLIIEHESEGSYENGQKGLFVPLADQSHCYFISDNNELVGTMLKSIQFSEGHQVARIVKLLRQQAMFNALIGSCVRKNTSRQDLDTFMFEINVVSLHFIQIFVEHPAKESIVTVELDLNDIRHVTCKINGSDHQHDSKLENYILRVFKATTSIPMVLRSLIKYWNHESSDLQRIQKRLYNNGIYGDGGDEREKGDGNSGSMDDSYNGSSQDTSGAFDICGINKNEIFFKTTEQKTGEKRIRNELEMNVDIFDRSNKAPRVMTFDLNDEEMVPLMNECETSMSPGSSSLGSDGRKRSVNQKPSSIDVFEFNDPSPPPATVMAPMPSPLGEPKKIPTPRQSPSTPTPFNRNTDIELIPLKSQSAGTDQSMLGPTSTISITPVNSGSANGSFPYEKPKSEKKKKRKREDGDTGSLSIAKKKSSDSLGTSPSKKSSSSSSSSSSSHLMGKPSFKPKKSPVPGTGFEDDLSFLNYPGGSGSTGPDQQNISVPSPLPSPQSLLKGSSGSSSSQRKSSLSAVINKLKSEMSDAMSSGADEKKGEYQIKSSGSDGIKITFNKTKSSKGSKSPKHTGLKPGVNSGPASKKSSQSSKSSSSSSSSQKLLYQKSSSSGSLNSPSTTVPSPKSSSQPGKSSKERSKEGSISPFSAFSGNSNDMLKNMLNQMSPSPRTDIMKAFDKKFQIPKLSARGKSDDKPNFDDVQNLVTPRSAPSTPIQSLTPSPTMDFMREGPSSVGLYQMSQQQKLFSNSQHHQQHQNKFIDQQRQNKKMFKSISSEQLAGSPTDKVRNPSEISDSDFQAFLRAQSKISDTSSAIDALQNVNNDNATNAFDDLDLNFIGNEI